MTHEVIAGLFVLALIFVFSKLVNKARERQIEPVDTVHLIREIDRLHALAHELQDCDDLLIDLRLCRHGESFRSFRMAWQSASGKEHAVDFLTDGSDLSARQMLQLAEAKREELNREVAARITNLYVLACQEDFENYRGRRAENCAENCMEAGERYGD